MPKPMISVAGIRGIVGDSLVPEDFFSFVQGFAGMLERKRVVVGNDTRPSNGMLRHIVFGALESSGCRVIDIGLCPTPTIGLMTKYLRAGGGIAITASHNPREWNALKFFSAQGIFLNKQENQKLLSRIEKKNFFYAPVRSLGKVESCDTAADVHIEKILSHFSPTLVRRKRFKVVCDLCDGAGTSVIPLLLEAYGCETVLIHQNTNGIYSRPLEPLPKHLNKLSRAVKNEGADIGFAVDPDSDRLAIVDEHGRAIGEERTISLCADYCLSKKKTPIVVNLSTTRAVDDVAARYGARVYRTQIGEAYVVKKMLSLNAKIGGEGNGGVIYAPLHHCRDAQTGIAVILSLMAERNCSVSMLNTSIPDYVMIKEKAGFDRERLEDMGDRLITSWKGRGKISKVDGIKLEMPESWIHVRPSGTEPILRIFVEASTQKKGRILVNETKMLLAEFLSTM